MTTLNAYATLAEFKNFVTARGGSAIPTDTTDDTTLELLLVSASRYLDEKTTRHYYPIIETRYFDVPDDGILRLDEDLLEVITLTNGDTTTIAGTDYIEMPANNTPYWGIKLKGSSGLSWQPDSDGNVEGVISLLGVWGYHNHYYLAWRIASTLAEDLDTTETGVDVADGTAFAVGNLLRVGSELGYVSNIATNTLTSTRGENGSTAATHLTAAAVKVWQVMDTAKQAVLEIANQAKARRFGQSLSNIETVTAGGIVLSPRDIPATAQEFVQNHRRLV
jgi:hypothetical protein